MIDVAIHECNPTKLEEIEPKKREAIEMFLRKLVYVDLKRSAVLDILLILRKIDWKDENALRIMKKLFTKVHKVKYSNISLMAYLVSQLSAWHPEFGVYVVDSTVEHIRIGLESNLFNENRQRMASARYLAELYNYRMISHHLVFDTLYLLLRFGHPNGLPVPNAPCYLDAPDDFFRLRLCCVILEGCGACFSQGRSATKLDTWFIFMQMYVFCKINPIPIDADFFITETKDLLRPFSQFYSTYQETVDALNRITMQENQVSPESTDVREVENEISAVDVYESEVDEVADEEIKEEFEDEYKYEIGDESGSEEDDMGHQHDLEDEDEEEDDLFDREYSRLVQESFETRRGRSDKKVTQFDASIPSKIKKTDVEVKAGHVGFTLLTKKGNKQQGTLMSIPTDSTFAITTLSQQRADIEERVQLKELVLNYDDRVSNGKPFI